MRVIPQIRLNISNGVLQMVNRIRCPNALLIGAQKAGTTSLFDWIAQHPQVFANPAIKDCPFFWHDATYKKGGGFYDSFFEKAGDEPILLGGNVNDIYFENVPERIHSMNPEAKLIICLRDPVERAYSAYAYAVERGHEDRGFSDAIMQEMSGHCYDNLIDKTQKEYIGHGEYWKQIKRFLQFFDRSQLHIVFFEDIRNHPALVVKEVYCFLGIDDAYSPTLVKKNVTASPAKLSWVNRAIFNLSLRQPWWWAAMKNLFSRELRYRMRRGVMSLQRKGGKRPPPPDPETTRVLAEYYKADNACIARFTGRDLNCWSN